MPLISKPNYNQIFASQAPEQDKPAVFDNYPEGWGPESRPNNGKPTIKGFNYLQQTSDLKDLWILQNGACLPYDESIEYAEGAPVLKDGVIQYKSGSGFKSRDAVSIPTYNNAADGVDPVTGVADGAYFNVRSSSDESYVDEYQNVDGSAVATGKSYPSSAALNAVKEAIIDPVTGAATASKVFNTRGESLEHVSEITTRFIESVADLPTNARNGQLIQTLSHHAGLGRGGAFYKFDTTKSAINNGITIIDGWVLQWDGKNLDLLQAGCYGDGDAESPHDDGVKIGECLNILFALGGGSLQGRGFSYLNETTNYDINTDNVFVVNAKIIRNNTLNNWMFRTAITKEINGGGFIKVEGKGNSTVVIGNGFINMGSNDFKHNKWVLQDIVADNFTQYGVGVLGGDYWYAKNIKILNHGLTTGTMTACMGFYVYPRNPGGSKGGVLDTVYSEIGTAAQANTALNAAAIKLQTHQKAKFSNIVAVGGYEQCLGIDSIDGEIKNVTVYPQGERVGLSLWNQNSAHLFSGQKFTLDGFDVRRSTGIGSYDLVIGAGAIGEYKLDGCTIKNGKTQGFFGLARTAFKDCVFENIQTTGVRLSPKFQSFEENTVKSTGNTFINVTASSTGFIVETNDSLIESCGTTAKATTNGVIIAGNENIVIKPVCVSSSNSLTLYTGSLGNFIDSPILKDGAGRAILFMGGSANNIVKQPTYLGSDSVLNSGDTTNKVEFVKSSGLTPTSTAADIVAALQSAGLAT